MKELTNAEAALLGLLTEQAMHPYHIEQEVKYRDMRSWTELSMSSIYKLLRKLELDGLVDCESVISNENRNRRVYSITNEGKKALKIKLCNLLNDPEHQRWQLDIATYNIDLLPLRKILNCLNEYRKQLLKNIQGYKELDKFLDDSGCPSHRNAVARRPIYMLEGEVRWLDDFVRELEEKK